MIAIGNDFGGPEHLDRDCPIRAGLDRAMNAAADFRDPNYDDGTKAWLNAIFIVPGSISKPDFEGYKRGHFSRKRKGLVVMIAVPQLVANGTGIAEFVGASLREAARLAKDHFSSKGIEFPLADVEELITIIEARVSSPSDTVH